MAVKSITPIDGGVCAPLGFRAAGVNCGMRKGIEPDLALIVSDVEAVAAGVFTSNCVIAWCVANNRRLLTEEARATAIVANAGNANACNGPSGRGADALMRSDAVESLGLPAGAVVLTASTGVIGRPFPSDAVRGGIEFAARELLSSPEASLAAARAIMTTDLVPKECAVEVETRAGTYRVGGIAKGSGMIAPNMATMLAFMTTDALVEPDVLQKHLAAVSDATFNCLTVDGDTSTNDMALILANGRSGAPVQMHDPGFERALFTVCEDLAKKIAMDGEGATKLVTVRVVGCAGDAKTVARTIAESPLVKTALFGNDPNWGRILAAAGRSGVHVDPEMAEISLAGNKVFSKGTPTKINLDSVRMAMNSDEVEILVDLGAPNGDSATIWTCDLSYDYVRINAEYTT